MVCARLMHIKNTSKDCDNRDIIITIIVIRIKNFTIK